MSPARNEIIAEIDEIERCDYHSDTIDCQCGGFWMVANVWGALMGSDESRAHNHRLDTSDLKGRLSWAIPACFSFC